MAGLSNHFDTMTFIKLAIDGLSLGVSTVIQPVCDFKIEQQTLPFVSISPYGPEGAGDELNDVDGVYYGTLIAIIQSVKMGETDDLLSQLELFLKWRQQIRRRLNNKSIPLIGTNYNIKIEPGNAVEKGIWQGRKLIAGAMIARAYFQETRLS